MESREVVEEYKPNRCFCKVIKKHGNLYLAIDDELNSLDKDKIDDLLEYRWTFARDYCSGRVRIRGDMINVVIEGEGDVKMIYCEGARRKNLGVIRKVLGDSGLKRVIRKK